MCRIVGIIQKNISELVLIKMRDALSYGGPDDFGIFIGEDHGIGLGHRRLSINDLSSAGHQPMVYKNWVVVFNGEVYNFHEISDWLKLEGYTFESGSDTEVILKAIDCWGINAIQKFRGMFAFAILNTQTRKLVLCRDRVGVKPLYWYLNNNTFLFASELKAFYEHPDFNKSISQEAISLFLQTGYIKAPFSIFQNTYKVEQGQCIQIDIDTLQIKKWKYWDINQVYNDNPPLSSNETEVLKDCENILTDAFSLRMVSDVPVGIFLSGGIDSALVTALLQKESYTKLNTFTIGFEDKKFDEGEKAKRISSLLGTNHLDLVCKEQDFLEVLESMSEIYDEPFGDSSAIPTIMVSKLASSVVKVSLSADGGDEIFGGYDRYLLVKKHFPLINSLPLGIRQFVFQVYYSLGYTTTVKLTKFLGFFTRTNLDTRLPRVLDSLNAINEIDFLKSFTSYLTKKELNLLHNFQKTDIFSQKIQVIPNNLVGALGVTDIKSYLEGDILTKVDRATMRVALEGREPFLDHKVIEFGVSLPDEYKIRNGETKWILKKILEKYLPKDCIYNPKKGFSIPLDNWLSGKLLGIILEMSEDQVFFSNMHLNSKSIALIVRDYVSGRLRRPFVIWFLLVLYLWYKKWM